MIIIDIVCVIGVVIGLIASGPGGMAYLPGFLSNQSITIGIRFWFLSCIDEWYKELKDGDVDDAPSAKPAAAATPTSINVVVQNTNTNTNQGAQPQPMMQQPMMAPGYN